MVLFSHEKFYELHGIAGLITTIHEPLPVLVHTFADLVPADTISQVCLARPHCAIDLRPTEIHGPLLTITNGSAGYE